MSARSKQTRSGTLDQLLLDRVTGKYKLVFLSIRWAEEIRKREELKSKPFNEVIDIALKELLSGAVNPQEVEKLPPVKKALHDDAAGSKSSPSNNHPDKAKPEKDKEKK